jgi:hypothetical protein
MPKTLDAKQRSPQVLPIRRPAPSSVLQRKCSCGGSPGPTGECTDCRKRRLGQSNTSIQAKLTVNRPGDRYEKEADRVAEQVLRMPRPQLKQSTPAADGEQREVLSSKHADTPKIARLERGSDRPPELSPETATQIRSLDGKGHSLPESTRSFFEPRFGYDFSRVRIHASASAAAMAESLGAHAFTTGRHIVFGSSEYGPETAAGRRLLAHELTHVVQQNPTTSNIAQTHVGGEPPAIQMKTNCWPFNGKIGSNAYPGRIEICIEGVISTRYAGWTSFPGGVGTTLGGGAIKSCGDDIDHVKEPASKKWRKIGGNPLTNNVDIAADGTVSGGKCWAPKACAKC